MIDRFRDHAANERTFLAWIRTAIALMAFGFVIEKFDLFIHYLAAANPTTKLSAFSGHRTAGAGLALMITGLLIILVASWGYLVNRRLINSDTHQQYRTSLPNIILVLIIAGLGLFLVTYVGYELLGKI